MLFKNTIINFHKIENPKWFAKTLNLLTKCYDIASIKDIEEYYYHNRKLNNVCHITFDDGDISFYNIVFPILKKYNVPASIYVSPLAAKERRNFWFQEIRGYDKKLLWQLIKNKKGNKVFNKIPSLNVALKSMSLENIWDAIRYYQKKTGTSPKPCMNMDTNTIIELHQSNLVEVGAHTLNHPILSNETNEVVRNEILSSIYDLGKMLDSEVRYFAYPNGIPGLDFGEREMDILQSAGIKLAFSTENKSFSQNNNPLSIPRNGISKGSLVFTLTKLISGRHWSKLKEIIKGKSNRMINDY